MAASLSDSALFMDMDHLFKEEDDASLATAASTASAMDFPASSLELVQLLAYDDDFLLDSGAHAADMFATHHDGSYNADELSDGATDDASSHTTSPPPTFAEDDHQTSPSSPAPAYGYLPSTSQTGGSGGSASASMHHPLVVTLKLPAPVSPPAAPVASPPRSSCTVAPLSLVPSNPTVSTVPSATMLPFAFPVACFPPLNANLKRPLPDVMPNQPASSLDPVEFKKSKRALRQMKNRESANRSRLRRKEQLTDLSVEVDELTKKQHELQNTIAALQAENKSLQDQNSFLRSLVTMYSDPARAAALPPMPAPVPAATTTVSAFRPQLAPTTRASLHDLESGHKSPTDSLMDESCDEDDDDEADDDEEDVVLLPTPKKQRKSIGRSAATVSAASLGLCASVFGLTILTDSDNGAAQSSYIRRPGRVLHSLPSTTTTDQGCSPSPLAAMVERAWELGSASWAFLTTSELAYGVFLNVLSFVIIMALYHCFQQHYTASTSRTSKRSFRWQNLEASSHRRGVASSSAAAAAQAKRRSVSWQDVRVEAHHHQQAVGDIEADASRVQVFT